jgi:hypothetical protein
MITGDSHIPDEELMLLVVYVLYKRERESHRAYLTLLTNARIQWRQTYTLGVSYHACFYCQIYRSECLHSDRLLCED